MSIFGICFIFYLIEYNDNQYNASRGAFSCFQNQTKQYTKKCYLNPPLYGFSSYESEATKYFLNATELKWVLDICKLLHLICIILHSEPGLQINSCACDRFEKQLMLGPQTGILDLKPLDDSTFIVKLITFSCLHYSFNG